MRYVATSNKRLSEISQGAAYMLMGKNLEYLDGQTHRGVVTAFMHMRQSYYKLALHTRDAHCEGLVEIFGEKF